MRFEDELYAQRMFQKVVSRSIRVGTTTCCYYSSLHLSAAKILAKVCHQAGQRAFIGKCNVRFSLVYSTITSTLIRSINLLTCALRLWIGFVIDGSQRLRRSVQRSLGRAVIARYYSVHRLCPQGVLETLSWFQSGSRSARQVSRVRKNVILF